MYILNSKGKELLSNFKLKKIAEIVGINPETLGQMVKKDRPCRKITAYCLTKILNADAEIEDYFIRKD